MLPLLSGNLTRMSSPAKVLPWAAIALVGATLFVSSTPLTRAVTAAQAPPRPGSGPAAEPHLRNIRQLTFGGENAEAYFSPDGTRLIFQSTREGVPCAQLFTMRIDGSDLRRVSNGTGRTTCGYYLPGRTQIA